MRNLIFAINLSLDGCCDHTKLSADEEIHEHYTQLMRDVDLLVYGRKTYQLMVPFWPDVAKNHSGPKSMNDFAEAFSSNQIIVFSKTLAEVDGDNTRVVRSNLKDEILKLKNEPGRSIATGGVSIPSQLIELGLVDEVHVLIQPVVVGEGRRLFDDLSLAENLQLKLVESKIFNSGSILLRYLKQ